jgi:glycosyltransferase involved in cell wall biosynthesis
MVIAAKLMGCKNIIYQVNNIAHKQSSLLDQYFDKFINKNVSFFITASYQSKIKLIKERKFNIEKIQQVPNTILEETISLSKEEIINDLSIKKTDFLLCSVGFLSKRKGQLFLLAALHQISLKHLNIFEAIKLLLVGDGEEEKYLKQFVKDYGLDKNVFFLGYQNKSINYISACDLFVFPSIVDEDMPLVVLSAMSKGKTILATDLAGIQEEIEDGVSGILVPPNTKTLVSDLANAIVNIYHNRNNSMGVQAQKRFYKLFSNSIYGNSIVNIYNSIFMKNKTI